MMELIKFCREYGSPNFTDLADDELRKYLEHCERAGALFLEAAGAGRGLGAVIIAFAMDRMPVERELVFPCPRDAGNVLFFDAIISTCPDALRRMVFQRLPAEFPDWQQRRMVAFRRFERRDGKWRQRMAEYRPSSIYRLAQRAGRSLAPA